MSRILVIPDPHAHPEHSNERADYLAMLIKDIKPDIVVNMGDQFDLPSLSEHDRGKRSFASKRYAADLEAGLDFSERLWEPVRAAKKKLPRRIFLEGNHEHRIERALDRVPELQGVIGFSDFDLDRHYDEVVRYNGFTPGVIEIEGILFAHFFPSGVMGRPVGGKWPAKALLEYNKQSSIQSHIHTFDYASTKTISGKLIHAAVVGCYQDYVNDWAGNVGRYWRPGVAILDNCENGDFDFTWLNYHNIKKMYA